jgi:polyhydroxyalkanoate synthase
MGLVMSEMARLQDVAQSGKGPDTASVTAMLLGMQKYQAFDRVVPRPDVETVWAQNQISLKCLSAQQEGGAEADSGVLLLVPSMVNRSGVFNLSRHCSMMQYFAQKGLRVYVLDWGESAQDEKQSCLNDVVLESFLPALRYIAETEGRAVHVLGYCMGGTLSVAAGHYSDGLIASCTFLAAPWDFDFQLGQLQNRIKFWAPSALQGLGAQNSLSKDWMQTVFATLDPIHTRDKFIRFAHMESGGRDEDIFVAVEDWLNDGVDLPVQLARECIEDWFVFNKPGRGEWLIDGQLIMPEHLDFPCLVVASKSDRLIDHASSLSLYSGLRDARLCEPACGHIGMVAGRHAPEQVWQPIAEFIASCKVN